jgi:hypothetical protein
MKGLGSEWQQAECYEAVSPRRKKSVLVCYQREKPKKYAMPHLPPPHLLLRGQFETQDRALGRPFLPSVLNFEPCQKYSLAQGPLLLPSLASLSPVALEQSIYYYHHRLHCQPGYVIVAPHFVMHSERAYLQGV